MAATFNDAVTDAGAASTALRGLAHASRHLPQPHDSYVVLGDLLAGVGSLEQVVRQLAELHTALGDRVRTDDGDTAAGREAASTAAFALQLAATALRQVQEHLDAASGASSRIVWPQTRPAGVEGQAASPARHLVARTVPQQPTARSFGRLM